MQARCFRTIIACAVVAVTFGIGHSVQAAQNVSTCAVLDDAGETYTLTADVSATGTCFTVAQNDITLNLNGRTVTYNTGAEDMRYGIAIPPHYLTRTSFPDTAIPDSAFTLEKRNFTVYGGTLTQASGNGTNSHGIRGMHSHSIAIHDLTINVHGDDTDAVEFNESDTISVYQNTLNSTSTVVTNRHQGRGVVQFVETSGGNRVYSNTITGGPQIGIRIAGYNLSTYPADEVHGNTIRQNGKVANCYAISAGAKNMKVYNNLIEPQNGRGIHVGNDNQRIYGNTITVKEGKNAEVDPGWSHGIKIEEATNAKIYDNVVTAIATAGYGYAYALDISVNANSNNEVYNNTFTATTDTADLRAVAVHIVGPVALGNGIDIHHNTFRSNNYNVWVNWNGGHDVLFRSNTFERYGTPINYHTIAIHNGGDNASSNIRFLDNATGTGASMHDLNYNPYSPGFSYGVEQYLNVVAKNAAGSPISGASVTVKNSSGAVAVSGTTASDGSIVLVVPTHWYAGLPLTATTYTPHSVSITANGFQAASTSVSLTESKTTTFTLQTSGSSSSTVSDYTAPSSYDPSTQGVNEPSTAPSGTAPTSSAGNRIITSPQASGGPQVRIFNAQGRLRAQFMAYESAFRGGVHAISADLEGDGIEEIITVPASNHSPQVKVFNANGRLLATKYVTTLAYRHGFQLAAGDVDGDGKAEIVVAANPGGGPQVVVLDYASGKLTTHASFFAYSKTLRVGLQLAVGDVNGDGKADIVTAPTRNASPQVRAFTDRGRVLGGFYPFSKRSLVGVRLALADVNGDSSQEIITVPGPGAVAQVAVWTYRGQRLVRFNVLPTKIRTGVFIQAADVDADGTVEIITAPLAGAGPEVSVHSWRGRLERRWFAYAKNNRTGTNLAILDADADGDLNIVTAPGRGSSPLVKTFSSTGRLLRQFFSHSQNFKGGVEVTGV
jgi:hypothetical protein